MDDLFSQSENWKRDILRSLGWSETQFCGKTAWQKPEGSIVTEDEAFHWLEEQENPTPE